MQMWTDSGSNISFLLQMQTWILGQNPRTDVDLKFWDWHISCMHIVCNLLIGQLQVPPDPDIVLAPQRNGCRVEIVGGVAHSTSLEVSYFTLTFTFCYMTLLMACCFLMDCKHSSLGLEMDQQHRSFIGVSCSLTTFTNVKLW